jgi:hypothetical protein
MMEPRPSHQQLSQVPGADGAQALPRHRDVSLMSSHQHPWLSPARALCSPGSSWIAQDTLCQQRLGRLLWIIRLAVGEQRTMKA